MFAFTSNDLRITAAHLTETQLRAARVLGGPREVGGIVQVEIGDETVWGRLGGQVVNRGGLRLSAVVYPTYEDAQRAEIADLYFGREATADKVDREYAARRAELEAVRS